MIPSLNGRAFVRGGPSPAEAKNASEWGMAKAFCSVVIAVLTCSPCMAPGIAFASRGHVFGKNFSSSGVLPGQLDKPGGMAVNVGSSESDPDSGLVYVADEGNRRVEVFTGTGAYAGEFDGSGQFETNGKVETGTPTPGGQFLQPRGVAVDNYCFVNKLTEPACRAADPSAGDVYVLDNGRSLIDKFTANGEYIGQITTTPEGPFEELRGVAVNQQGKLVLYDLTSSRLGVVYYTNEKENSFLKRVKSITPENGFVAAGLAVNSLGDDYLRVTDEGVVEINENGLKINLKVEGEAGGEAGEWGLATEIGTDDVYIDNRVSSVERFNRSAKLIEKFGHEGAGGIVEAGGLAVNSRTGQVYVADVASSTIGEFPLEPPSAPAVASATVSDIASSSATFGSIINPHGEPTTYQFEYGVCETRSACATSSYPNSVPASEQPLPGDFEEHAVNQHVQGLSPGTIYHVRVMGENKLGGKTSAEVIFETQSAIASTEKIDNRTWELVSPPDKNGARLLPIAEVGLAQASTSGDAMTYIANAPTEKRPSGNSNLTQVISRRQGSGWVSRDLTIPHSAATGFSLEGQEVRFFTPDLSVSVLQPFGSYAPNLAADSSEQTAYLRSSFSGSGFCESDCFTPLVTAQNVFEGVQFGNEEGVCPPKTICGPLFLDATPDAKHVVVESEPSLIEDQTVKDGLYEWSAEGLSLINYLPNGEPSHCVSKTAPCGKNPHIPVVGNTADILRHAVSNDGNRVIWSELGGHLYLRDTALKQTVQLDAVQGGSGLGTEVPEFELASEDGSSVLFTDEQRLTADSGGGTFARDLYRCDIAEEGGQLKCDLTDLTPIQSGESMRVQGAVIDATRDLSTVYFVADGVMPGSNGVAGNCLHETAEERCNLYRWHEGIVSQVADLSGADAPDWAHSGGLELNNLTSSASPDGEWLAFMSQLPLTGYDNRDAASGRPDEEVYLFDAAAGSGEAALRCASCDPSGARPKGAEYKTIETENGGVAGGDRVWGENQWLAAEIPGWTPYRVGTALYHSRFLSNSGRLFFNSSDALVSQDVNGNTEDVYEVEPASVGDCQRTSSLYVSGMAVCLGLISVGTSSDDSAFLDASEGGGDVFFLTTAKLSGADSDASLDVYDAHECAAGAGGCEAAASVQLEPCVEADTCRGAATPPLVAGALASQSASGSGNLLPPSGGTSKAGSQTKPTKKQQLTKALSACKKLKKKTRRKTCEATARRRFGPKAKKKKARK
jgi:hypothetical protein